MSPSNHSEMISEMRQALETTRGNIRSLGPAGALGPVPMPYREWLAIVEAALEMANERQIQD